MKNNTVFNAILITNGRKTKKEHAVMLRAVAYNQQIYFSRRNNNSDWLKNVLVDPNVIIIHDNKKYYGKASILKNKDIINKVSNLKYKDIMRQKEKRIVIEIKLAE